MASSATSLSLIALLVASCAALCSAVTYTVGDGQGWTTGVDYNAWTRGKMFVPGDSLVFNYQSQAHTVTEVNQGDYDSCSNNSPLSNQVNGPTTVPLQNPGTRYFICGVPGHCTGGMKLAVTVSTPGAPGFPGVPPPPFSSGAGGLAQAGAAVAAVAGVLVKVALF